MTSAELATPGPGRRRAPPASTKRWYVVHAYSGMEKVVERNLQRISARAWRKFGKILVPMEEVVELKNGKKAVSERRFFPGYVLVEMDMDDDTWHLVKHTAKVTGFVGGAKNRPAPISEAEVNKIVHQMQEGVEAPRPKVQWVVGELVRVKEGPFTDFNGAIEDVNYDKSRSRVGDDLRPGDAGRTRFRAGRRRSEDQPGARLATPVATHRARC